MKSTSDFNWLHFSDLHIAQPGFDSGYARKQLLSFLSQEIENDNFNPDYIFITGDVAHKGNYGNAHL
jgi:predicted MPP superfamily phosphohydrolase